MTKLENTELVISGVMFRIKKISYLGHDFKGKKYNEIARWNIFEEESLEQRLHRHLIMTIDVDRIIVRVGSFNFRHCLV